METWPQAGLGEKNLWSSNVGVYSPVDSYVIIALVA